MSVPFVPDTFNSPDTTFFRVFDTSNNELAALSGLPEFLGIVSDVAIGRILYDDGITPGGMGLTELKVAPVPAPTAVILCILGFGAVGIKLRSRKEA
jgi:hypothetical protein